MGESLEKDDRRDAKSAKISEMRKEGLAGEAPAPPNRARARARAFRLSLRSREKTASRNKPHEVAALQSRAKREPE